MNLIEKRNLLSTLISNTKEEIELLRGKERLLEKLEYMRQDVVSQITKERRARIDGSKEQKDV